MIQIISTLDNWDQQLLLSLNGGGGAIFDQFIYYFSDKWVWIPFYLSLLFTYLFKDWKRGVFAIFMTVLAIALSDQISSSIIKPLVMRLRPTQDPEINHLIQTVNNYHGGLYGFVSSHAANSAALAFISSMILRNRNYSIVILIWVLLMGYTRIYLGVHYPLDVLAGWTIGLFVSMFCYWIYNKYSNRIPISKKRRSENIDHVLRLPIWVILCTIVVMLLFSLPQ